MDNFGEVLTVAVNPKSNRNTKKLFSPFDTGLSFPIIPNMHG